ncbi:MAG: response regulator transcription factor [Motiliproteus sp.]|nr:response regulator transcription factor [Motiliproteus sp.]MCW9052630.1 response regulator transcription factor [Motiliproteus sp.]
MRLLLIEDDPLLGQGIKDALDRDGDTLDWLTQGRQGISAIKTSEFDLLILDLGLPDIDGLEVLRQIRAGQIDLPVIVLTARDQVSDRVKGLDSGADDYLIKPFDLNELRARIRALLRRHSGFSSPVLKHGELEVDPSSREVLHAGQPIQLSRREYALLLEFMHHPGRVFTRDQLNEKLYGWGEEVESNSIEVHIHHLRKKIGSQFIRTIRGVGYRIEGSH